MTYAFDLAGRTAVVTGANTGLGQAIAVALAQAGASIVAVGRSSMDETEHLCREAGAGFHPVRADLASLEPIERIVAEATSVSGRIDVLVNNAGIIRRADAIDFTEKEWDDVMNVNLKSTFFLSQAVARTMLADGRGGKIINISSVAARKPDRSGEAYQASKAGVLALNHAIMEEEWANGLRAPAILPGMTDTPLLDRRPTPVSAEVRSAALQPEDIAEACLFVM